MWERVPVGVPTGVGDHHADVGGVLECADQRGEYWVARNLKESLEACEGERRGDLAVEVLPCGFEVGWVY